MLTSSAASASALLSTSGVAPTPEIFLPNLALALGIGLLIGIERGWRLRDEKAGSRVAGVRTFSLLGLLGGLVGLEFAGPLRLVMLLFAGAAVAAILIGYRGDTRHDGNLSATSAIASALTMALGAAAGGGHAAVASVGAGATVILLALREPLHRALLDTSEADIRALVRLALVVFVILPLLPDTPLGPYALNPRRLWTVVVITGAISFVGYVLIRILGGRKGIMLTAAVGGLVSSTAVTLECSRRMRADESIVANQAAIVVASTIMMARATVLVGILTPAVFSRFLGLVVPATISSALLAAGLTLRLRGDTDHDALAPGTVKPPDLKLALLFGGLVLVMATAAAWAEQHFRGGAVVLALGGLFDVDSAIAALGTLPPGALSLQLASFAVATPLIFNSLLKAGLAVVIAGPRRGWIPALGLIVPAAAIGGTIAAQAL